MDIINKQMYTCTYTQVHKLYKYMTKTHSLLTTGVRKHTHTDANAHIFNKTGTKLKNKQEKEIPFGLNRISLIPSSCFFLINNSPN